jgi:hypothetical protein
MKPIHAKPKITTRNMVKELLFWSVNAIHISKAAAAIAGLKTIKRIESTKKRDRANTMYANLPAGERDFGGGFSSGRMKSKKTEKSMGKG